MTLDFRWCAVLGLVVGLALPVTGQVTTLAGNYTADDFLRVYLSTDLVAEPSELIAYKSTLWGATESFSGITVPAGQDLFLLVEATNSSGPAMFVADFTLSGTGHFFAKGASPLVTNTTDWTASETAFAATGTPVSAGLNTASLAIWGQRPGIASEAAALWPYLADWSTGRAGTVYFATRIEAIPQPSAVTPAALGALTLALVGGLRRPRRDR